MRIEDYQKELGITDEEMVMFVIKYGGEIDEEDIQNITFTKIHNTLIEAMIKRKELRDNTL